MTRPEYFRVRYYQEYFPWRPELRPHFFERDQFHHDASDPGDLRSLSINKTASIIQSWLFFGLLDVVTGSTARLEAYRAYFERESPEPLHDSLVAAGGQQSVQSIQEYVVVNEEQIVTDAGMYLPGPQQRGRVHLALAYLDFARIKCEQLDEASYWTNTAADALTTEDFIGPLLLSIRLLLGHLRLQVHRFERIPSRYDVLAGSIVTAFRSQTPKEGRQTYSQYNKLLGPALPPGTRHHSILSDRVLVLEFARSNWCPARAWQVRCSFNILSVYSLARAQRRKETGANHASCDGVCTAYNMSPQELLDYRQIHVENCDCRPEEPHQPDRSHYIVKEIFDIINDDAIPLISLQILQGKPQMKVVRYDGSAAFTAISHVWRDGLGNTMANNVHDCQLERLASILYQISQQNYKILPTGEKWTGSISRSARQLGYRLGFRLGLRLRNIKPGPKDIPQNEGVLFWLDTLCIPCQRQSADAEAYRAVKNKAIRLITPTFQAASQVLVLDSDLETLRGSASDDDAGTSIEECLMGGKWIQRVWTLEEGGQARQCWVRIADGSVHKLRSDSDSFLSGPLNAARKVAINMGNGRKAAYWLERTRVTQFKDAWNNIQCRSISDRSDLLKTFASILDLDPKDVPRYGTESSKLATVVKSCRSVPLALLFTRAFSPPTGAVREDRGLDGWIPPSLETNPITDAASMRSLIRNDEHYGFEIRLKDVYESESLEVMKLPTTELFASGFVQLKSVAYSDHNLVLETQCGPIHRPDTEALIIFDKAAGSRSLNAYFALGALLILVEDDAATGTGSSRLNGSLGGQQSIIYKHLMHLTVYLPDQWKLRYDGTASDFSGIPEIVGSSLPETFSKIVIRTEITSKSELIGQRPPRDYPSTTPHTLLAYLSAIAGIVLPSIIRQYFDCWKDKKPCWAERCPDPYQNCDPFRNCPDPYWNGRLSPGCTRVYFLSLIPVIIPFSFGLFLLRRFYARRNKIWLQAMLVENRVRNGRSSRAWWNRLPLRRRYGSPRDVEGEGIGLVGSSN